MSSLPHMLEVLLVRHLFPTFRFMVVLYAGNSNMLQLSERPGFFAASVKKLSTSKKVICIPFSQCYRTYNLNQSKARNSRSRVHVLLFGFPS